MLLKIVKQILKNFEEPANIESKMIKVQLSIGITMVNKSSESVTDIIKQADIAMYNAKASKEQRYSFFKTEMESVVLTQFNLLNDFPNALLKGELQLYFQPFYTIEQKQLFGFECLIRWHHSSKGLLTPDVFLPILKDTEYMAVLENWILEEGIKKCQLISQFSSSALVFSINLSADMFMSANLINKTAELLKLYQVEAKHIYIEIVEDTLINDMSMAIERINALKELGVKVSMDDFGVGYSSLNYLRQLPADNIKIDRSFVSEILQDPTSEKLLASLIELLINIDKSVTAEGIENQEQLAWLQAQGCHIGQGYFFNKPLPLEKAIQLCQSYENNVRYVQFNNEKA